MDLTYNSFDDEWVYVLEGLEMSPGFDTEEDAKHWYKSMYTHFLSEFWSNT